MTDFHIGQKVVCVDDRTGACVGDEVKRGQIYTISALIPGRKDATLGLEDQVLAELSECPTIFHFKGMPGRSRYGLWCFHPLEEKPDSIELFREIARGVSDGKPIIEDAEYRLPTPEKVRA